MPQEGGVRLRTNDEAAASMTPTDKQVKDAGASK
jgi:hypothetical protein